MNKLRILLHCLIAGFIMCALVGCWPPRDHAVLPMVSEEMLAWARNQWPDFTPEQLHQGHEAMVGHCTKCHSMPSPDHERPSEWPAVMSRMAHKANLGDADQTAMLRYILTARAMMEPKR